MDFSKNGTIENCDKLQSEHWVTRLYTLFMSVFSFLQVQVNTWNMTEGELCVGDEVIVDGEIYEHGTWEGEASDKFAFILGCC
jgi:hypothetical protein